MANNISIVVSVQNKATAPLQKVKKDVQQLQSGLKDFNRDLFATTALIGTFAYGFSKALDSAKIGAQYDYMRNQFYNLFDPKYFRTLMDASRGTVDAMSLMSGAVQAYTTGLNKEQVKTAMGISVWAAKRTGKSTAEAFKELVSGLNSGRLELAKFLGPSLKFNDSLMMMNKMIGVAGQGFIGAGAKGAAFRNTLLNVLETQRALSADTSEGYLEALMRTGAAFKSLGQVMGDFITRAMAPAVSFVGTKLWNSFYKLDEIIGAADEKTVNIRDGLVDLVKVIGSSLGTFTAMWGSFKVLTMFLGTTGTTLKGLIGLVTLTGMVFKTAYGESESFRQFIANLGTGFMFLYEAMKTWEDGTVTITGNVYARFKKLSPETQDFLHNMVEGLGLVKEAILGAGQSFKFLFDMISKTLKVFGMWDGKTNKIGHGWLTAARGVGMVGGAVAMGYAVKQILPGLRSLPLIGKMFGGGSPGSSMSNPMFTKEVGVGGALGAAGTSMSLLGEAIRGIKTGIEVIKGRAGVATLGGAVLKGMAPHLPWLTAGAKWLGKTRLGGLASRGMGMAAEGVKNAGLGIHDIMSRATTSLLSGGVLVPLIAVVLAAVAAYMLWKNVIQPWKEGGWRNIGGSGKTGWEKDKESDKSPIERLATTQFDDSSVKKSFKESLSSSGADVGNASASTMAIVNAIMENSRVTKEESQGLAKYLNDIRGGMSPDQALLSFKKFTLGHS